MYVSCNHATRTTIQEWHFPRLVHGVIRFLRIMETLIIKLTASLQQQPRSHPRRPRGNLSAAAAFRAAIRAVKRAPATTISATAAASAAAASIPAFGGDFDEGRRRTKRLSCRKRNHILSRFAAPPPTLHASTATLAFFHENQKAVNFAEEKQGE